MLSLCNIQSKRAIVL